MSAADVSEEVRRSLPGWSLKRETPRPAKKQGWECPAPTVEDWEDYKRWKQEQEKKDELPAAPQIFLADSSLLFYQDPDVQLPWIHRLRCELPRRVGRLSGELPVKASYIGFGTSDNVELYELFKTAVAQIGVVLCRQIHFPPSRFEIAHLEQSDLIVVGGGDRKRLWETLSTDISSEVAEHVKWRYLQGAVVVAIGEAMSLLGEKSWYSLGEGKGVVPYRGWKIFPHIIASEAEGTDLEDMVEQLGGAGVVILGIHNGGGLIFNRDGLVEPVRNMVQEYRWDWQSSSVKRALLIGPPRSTGLICPLYNAMRQRQGEAGDDEEVEDVWAYALTQEEELEEEHLLEHFDPLCTFLGLEEREEAERLKQRGNEAFKAKKADLANLHYGQARVLLGSAARRWSELAEDTRKQLDSLQAPKKQAQLPSEKRKELADKDLGQKDDYRVVPLQTALLLNICACHLLAHEQDRERQSAPSSSSTAPPPAPTADEGASSANGDANARSTMLVEVRDNLVEAFRAANEALRLSCGRSAKAWYRRGCVFEKMRDPRNAIRDFEEALLRAPGDKNIAKRRDDVKEAASKVAEIMYYARHKELDAQEKRLRLETRRALYLRGGFWDTYQDDRGEFAVAQPIARVVEGTLEEIDGRTRLSLPENALPEQGAPYLHPHALWTWEFLVQRAPGLQLLEVENLDLGSGPLEWLCKGLRTHQEVKTLKLTGVHLGPAGARMLRNVIAQSTSLLEVALDSCALHDAGLSELAQGLQENPGRLEVLSLKDNYFTARRVANLADVLCKADNGLSLTELDLSGNPLGVAGAREVARTIASAEHRLRALRLQNCLLDLAAFWRLVGNLDDSRPLSTLDLRCNPIGRGTRRCWRSTMGPTIRCEVLLSDHPLRAQKQLNGATEAVDGGAGFPPPRSWV